MTTMTNVRIVLLGLHQRYFHIDYLISLWNAVDWERERIDYIHPAL